mmetsp:Transcript_3713/g.7742  ORF Transcript_3713/g.7742 Transcript_3713/m.7742 type:complete len:216 (-) Transcript_3713:690-1337(-)
MVKWTWYFWSLLNFVITYMSHMLPMAIGKLFQNTTRNVTKKILRGPPLSQSLDRTTGLLVTKSLPTSFTVAHPHIAMAASTSLPNIPSMSPTPCSPLQASAKNTGRPNPTAVAPSANALTTSDPLLTPPSIRTGTRPPTAVTTSGRASIAPRHPSRARPPWFDTITPSTPAFTAHRASSAVIMPLTIRGRFPHASRFSQVTSSHERFCSNIFSEF